jgi:HAD superfamily hydrolase (TIGR01450 family)
MVLAARRLFLFDLDGVLYAGKDDSPRLLGGIELFRELQARGRVVYVVSNTTTHTREEVLARLRRLGFPLELEQVLTASWLTALYIRERWGPSRCYCLGEEGLARELEGVGHEVCDDGDFVVVGVDRGLTFERLDHAYRLLRQGARLVACHMARVYMDRERPRVAVGPLVRALEYAAGVRALAVGKPAPAMFRMAMKMARVGPGETVMVGDQMETDIKGALRLGIYTVLVLTGVESRETLARYPYRPHLIVERVDDLLHHL